MSNRFDGKVVAITGSGSGMGREVARIVAAKGPIEPFDANDITREIEERWGDRLKRRVDPRSVGAKLRRMSRVGFIHQLRAGRAFHGSLYSRTPAAPGESL